MTDEAVLERIRKLAIPPAWQDVWICPWPNGHIQAVGTDAAGRRQYRYHDDWRKRRDHEKFEHITRFAQELPALRRAVTEDLASEGLNRERVLAVMVRLLDVAYFRVGGEEYAEEHDTFGVSTLRREHVQMEKGAVVFHYQAKGGIDRSVRVSDPDVVRVVQALRRRRSGSGNLFAWREGARTVDAHSSDVNAYIKSAMGDEFTAKDFRTWSATVLAAVVLARSDSATPQFRGRNRVVVAAVKEVAAALGNTPAVCRASYIDPRVIDRYIGGETVQLPGTAGPAATGWTDMRPRIESAVLKLLTEDGEAGAAAA